MANLLQNADFGAAPGPPTLIQARTCFFLGAGASAEFGVPLTAEILPLIRTRLRESRLFRGDEERCKELERFLSVLLPGFAQASKEALPNIVDLLSLLDHSLRSSTTPIPQVAVPEISQKRSLLELAICDVISQGEEGATPSRLTGDSLWGWIKRNNDIRRDSLALISTNYDTSVEQLIDEAFAGELGSIAEEIDFGFSWRDPERNHLYPRPVEPWLRFFKLHGSLNWLRCDLCEHIYVNYHFKKIYARVLDAEISPDNTCHCGHAKLSSMLVTPSYVRDVREPNLLTIWRNALELLRTSDHWVMVGYSLPPDDVNIRSMLMRAFHGRLFQGPPQVTVVLKGDLPDVFARYQVLFPELEKYTDGFGAYINGLG